MDYCYYDSHYYHDYCAQVHDVSVHITPVCNLCTWEAARQGDAGPRGRHTLVHYRHNIARPRTVNFLSRAAGEDFWKQALWFVCPPARICLVNQQHTPAHTHPPSPPTTVI